MSSILKNKNNIDNDIKYFDNVFNKITNEKVNINNNLLAEYNRLFYKNYNNISNKTQNIMNKNKIIMINNREATRKANMISLLKLTLFWAIIITLLNFLRISNRMSNKGFILIGIISFALIFVYYLYTTQRGSAKIAAENISALSDATTRGFAKAAAINFIPKSVMNPYTCPKGCNKVEPKETDKIKDYDGKKAKNKFDNKILNLKYSVSMDPSKTGLPYMYQTKKGTKQFIKGIEDGKALCYTCKAISENDNMNSNDLIKSNVPCKYIIGYEKEPNSKPYITDINECKT
tara:strand:+ start:222 stop:1091 length:870 start_codon:yes stop_codon:yes gene_type:complete